MEGGCYLLRSGILLRVSVVVVAHGTGYDRPRAGIEFLREPAEWSRVRASARIGIE